MATTSKTLVTAERFMEMGLGPGSFELVKGEVIEVSPGNYSHGIVCAAIVSILRLFGKQSSGLSKFD